MKQKSYADIVSDLKVIGAKLKVNRIKQSELIVQLNKLSSASKRLTNRAKKLNGVLNEIDKQTQRQQVKKGAEV